MSNTAVLGEALLGDMILGEVGSDETTTTPPGQSGGHGHKKPRRDEEIYEGLRL